MDIIRSNKIKYCLYEVFTHIITLLTSGAVIQSFLLENGLSEESVGVFLSIIQTVSVVIMLLYSRIADRIRSLITSFAYVRFLELPLCAFLLYLCFCNFENIRTTLIFLTVLGVLFGISKGISNVLAYKLPYVIIDIADYGSVTSVAGICGGIATIVFSLILTVIQSRMDYFASMKYAYGFNIIVFFMCVLTVRLMKPQGKYQTAEKKVQKKINLLKYKPFSYLLLPNLMRGFSAGIIGLAVTVGYYTGHIDKDSAGVIVVITYATTILGCLTFLKTNKKTDLKLIILISSIAVGIFLPMLVVYNTSMFFVAYTFLYFFYVIINYAIPFAVTKIVDYDVMGQYSALRMLLHTLGIALAGFVYISLFKLFGVLPTLIISGGMQLISGISYWFFLKKINT